MQPIVEPWPGEGGLAGVWFREADGSGAVVAIRVRGRLEEEIVDLADRVQDWAVEALNAARESPVWPECPRHPDSHPVEARLIGDEPTWVCPRDQQPVERIGHVTSGIERGRSRRRT